MSVEILVALIALVGTCLGATVNGYFIARNGRVAAQMASAMRTNNGKRPGEYLEMIADVKVSQEMLGYQVDRMIDMHAEHLVSDDQHFREIRQQVAALASQGIRFNDVAVDAAVAAIDAAVEHP